MKHFLTNIEKSSISRAVLAHIPKNKRGFTSRFSMEDILTCMLYKLKTGCQWSCLFVDLPCMKPPFSYQTVYYYFNKWSKAGVFEAAFKQVQKEQEARLSLNLLHLDGTHSLAKKGGKKLLIKEEKEQELVIYWYS